MSSSRNNSHCLPDDIFGYNNEEFYDYIKKSYGDDLYGLFIFQSIRNGLHLLQTTCDEILLIFQEESEEIDKLRQLCCFKINNNRYEIKLGVKLAINKKKRTSTKHRSSNLDTLQSADQNQSHTIQMNASPTISFSSVPVASSTQSTLPLTQNSLTYIEHLTNVEQRINKWWYTYNNDDSLSLTEGTHYLLKMNKSSNETCSYTLSCQCRIQFKLPLMSTGLLKLSTYYRHLKEQQCFKMSETIRKKDNSSINNENSLNQSISSPKRSRSSSAKRNTNRKANSSKKNKPSLANDTSTDDD